MRDLARWYAVLELQAGSSREEVRRAYRELAQVWHPDRFEGRPDLRARAEERLKAINEAYRQLTAAWAEEDRAGSTRHSGEYQHEAQKSPGSDLGGTPVQDRIGPMRLWWYRVRQRIRVALSLRRVLFALAVLTASGFGVLLAWIINGSALVSRGGERLRFTQVSAAAWHACGLDGSGAVYCWGRDDDGQLGNGEGSDVCGGTSTFPCSLVPRRIRFAEPFVSVVTGWMHTCALAEDGEAYCWGAGFAGQTGLGQSTAVITPSPVPLPQLQSISTFNQHTCGLSGDGSIYCWGSDDSGQVGDAGYADTCSSDSGAFPCTLHPTRIGPDRNWSAVSAGGSHTCALSNGQVFCWGSNRSGQLGSPGESGCGSPGDVYPCRRLPRVVASNEPFTHISTGAAHTCALSNSGTAWCWGDNTYGQLGNATVESSSAPVRVAGNHVFQSIEARGYLTCATATNGRLFCWGQMPGGLGSATRTCNGSPCALVPTSLRFSAGSRVASGLDFACILAGRYQKCWGRNDMGQLGNGRLSATLVSGPRPTVESDPRRMRMRPARALRNFFNSIIWGARRFVVRLMSPIFNALQQI